MWYVNSALAHGAKAEYRLFYRALFAKETHMVVDVLLLIVICQLTRDLTFLKVMEWLRLVGSLKL